MEINEIEVRCVGQCTAAEPAEPQNHQLAAWKAAVHLLELRYRE